MTESKINFLKMKNNFKQGRVGLSMVELIITIGVMAIVVSAGFVNLRNFQGKNALSNEADSIVAVLRRAQQNAVGQENASAWGVKFFNQVSGGDYYQVFYGASYATGTADSIKYLSLGLKFTSPTSGNSTEILFVKGTGLTNVATVVIAESKDLSNTKTVSVNALGLAKRDD